MRMFLEEFAKKSHKLDPLQALSWYKIPESDLLMEKVSPPLLSPLPRLLLFFSFYYFYYFIYSLDLII